MRIIVKLVRVKTILSLVAVLCFATGIATAGGTAHDYEFTLPCRAYWNSILLKAGNYRFTLDRTSIETRLLLSSEGRYVAILLASHGHSDVGSSGSGTLTLTRGDAAYYVSALSVPDRGLILYYFAPKAAGKNKSQVREAVQRVPLLPARK